MKKINEKSKLKIAVVFNLAIVVFEIVALVLSLKRRGWQVLLFFTQISNYFSLVSSIIFVTKAAASLKTNNSKPKTWVHVLRFVSTCLLMVTFLMVIFVLIPFMPQNAIFWLFGNSNLFQHTICPILSVVSFLTFENTESLSKKSLFFAILPTVLYGAVMLTLNLLKLVTGPYPFFYVYEFAWFVSVPWLGGILLFVLAINVFVYLMHKKLGKNKQKTLFQWINVSFSFYFEFFVLQWFCKKKKRFSWK